MDETDRRTDSRRADDSYREILLREKEREIDRLSEKVDSMIQDRVTLEQFLTVTREIDDHSKELIRLNAALFGVDGLNGMSAKLRDLHAIMVASEKTTRLTMAEKTDIMAVNVRLDSQTAKLESLENESHDREVAARVHSQRDQRATIFKNKWTRALAVGLGAITAIAGPYLGAHLHF